SAGSGEHLRARARLLELLAQQDRYVHRVLDRTPRLRVPRQNLAKMNQGGPAVRTPSMKPSGAHSEPPLSARDIGRRAASGAALLTAKGIFAQALGLASTIVVARLLLPDQLGLYAIALTISTFLLTLGSGLGMAAALIRRPVAPDLADLRAFVALQLIISSSLAGVVILASRPFALVGQLTAVMVLSAPVIAFRGAALVVLERQLLYKR